MYAKRDLNNFEAGQNKEPNGPGTGTEQKPEN